ncbi:MAG: hypothetical protein K2F91_08840, partial [Muribaculaceae bacterium]|nr:hypothetical protein [Muribaculaceae bacterium]
MENTGTTALLERCLSVPDGMPLPQADADALRLLMEAMPSATILPLLLLRHGAARCDEETAALQERLALMCADRRTLAFAAHGEAWADFYPADDEPEAKQTVDVIDTFLRTYGTVTPEEERMLERMIFNPTPDYAEMLAREEQENLPAESSADTDDADDPQAARINAFIRSQHPAA